MTFKVPLKDALLAQTAGAAGTDMIDAPPIGALNPDTLTNVLGAIYDRFENKIIAGITNSNLASGLVLEAVVTSTTRPVSYPVGAQIQETDTGKTFKNTGTVDTPVWSEITANQTHDSLAGLTGSDPHTQYALTDGTRLHIYRGASAPAGPGAGQLWMDTSTAPPTLKEYDGGSWEIPQASGGGGGGGGTATNIDNSNLATGRALEAIGSSTARPGSYPIGGILYETDTTKLLKNTGTIPSPIWLDVISGSDHNSLSGLTTGDPHTQYALASGARLVGLRQNTAPSSPLTGQLWFDTSTTPATLKQYSGTAWTLPQATPVDASITTAKLAAAGALTIPKVNLAALNVDNIDLATGRSLIALVTSTTHLSTYPVGGQIQESDTGKTFKNTGTLVSPVWSEITANQTHGSLSGLTTGDPHTQYALSDGTRLRGYRGTVSPSSPLAGQLWMDTSTAPPTLKEYSGSAWEIPQGGGAASDMLSPLINAEVSITAATTLTAASFGKMHVLSGIANYPITLPAASGNAGKMIGFRVPNSVAIARVFSITITGADTGIKNSNTFGLMQGDAIVLESNGSGWVVVDDSLIRPRFSMPDYVTTTTVSNGTLTIGTSGWTQLGSTQSFTLLSSTSICEIMVGGSSTVLGGSAFGVYTELYIDGSTEVYIGGGFAQGSNYANPMGGAQPALFPNLSGSGRANPQLTAGTHTLAIRATANTTACAWYCRSAIIPWENIYARVLEWR